jgi:nitrate reductase (cytochrome), electron transfer subunit
MMRKKLCLGLLSVVLVASMAGLGCQKQGPSVDACSAEGTCPTGEKMACCPSTLVEAGDMPELDDGMDVWFRDSDLDAMATQIVADYGEVTPGESTVEYVAFYGAPPQIPHSVEDMLPILADENMCMDCHAPENADEDTPAIPESHFMTTLMAKGESTDVQVWKVVGEEKMDVMSGMRWNCTLCHTPQATNVINIPNSFE